MRTVNFTVYSFNELNEIAQKIAIENFRAHEAYADIYGADVNKVAEKFLESNKIFKSEIYFDLMCGYEHISFSGRTGFFNLIEMFDDSISIISRLKKWKSEQKIYDHNVYIESYGEFPYCEKFRMEYENIENVNFKTTTENEREMIAITISDFFEIFVKDYIRNLSCDIGKELLRIYNYRISDEGIREEAMNGGYEFFEDGSIYNAKGECQK